MDENIHSIPAAIPASLLRRFKKPEPIPINPPTEKKLLPLLQDVVDEQWVVLRELIHGNKESINPKWFEGESHKLLLDIALQYRQRGAVLTPKAITIEVKGHKSEKAILCAYNMAVNWMSTTPLKTAILILQDKYARDCLVQALTNSAIITETKGTTKQVRACLQDALRHIPDGESLESVDAYDLIHTMPPPVDDIIESVIGTGDKLAIIAPSKSRKSFFAMQMALAVSTGTPLLKWNTKIKKVMLVQMEIRDHYMHRRIHTMAKAMNVNPQGMLHIINGRGKNITIEGIINKANELGDMGLIILDPVYKMMKGQENDARDMAELVAGFDEIAEATKATIAYIHHDAKGRAGDRDTRDRGSGSNVIGRDYDSCITLTAHAEEDGAQIIEVAFRNHAFQEPFAVRWDGYYKIADNLSVMPETTKTALAKRNRGPSIADLCEKALEVLGSQKIRSSDYNTLIQDKLGIGVIKAREIIAFLTATNQITKEQEMFKGGGIMIAKS